MYRYLLGSLFLVLSSYAWPKPLSDLDIKQAKNIVIVEGIFDPWTMNDQLKVQEIIKAGQGDLVIILPVDPKNGNIPLPLKNRLELVDSVNASSSQITYTDKGADIKKHITAINSKAKISTLKISPSTLDIRLLTSSSPEYYFSQPENLKTPAGHHPKVVQKIFQDGLYLGSSADKPSVLSSFLSRVTNFTSKLGLYDKIREVAVKLTARPDLKSVQLGGETIEIKKYLASGLTGDAYIIDVGGESLVLKLSKDHKMAKNLMQQAALTHEWLKNKTQIELPRLVAFDPEGSWQTIELVKGKSLDKLIADNGGKLTQELEEKLRNFHSEASKVHKVSAINLDISADNIFIRESDGKAVLVDFGPIPPDHHFTTDFNEAKVRWENAGRALYQKNSSRAGACFSAALKKLIAH